MSCVIVSIYLAQTTQLHPKKHTVFNDELHSYYSQLHNFRNANDGEKMQQMRHDKPEHKPKT